MPEMAEKNKAKFELRIRCDWCKSCGYCIVACPKDVLEFSEGLNVRGVHPVVAARLGQCTGCCACVVVCPDMAIEVYKNGAE